LFEMLDRRSASTGNSLAIRQVTSAADQVAKRIAAAVSPWSRSLRRAVGGEVLRAQKGVAEHVGATCGRQPPPGRCPDWRLNRAETRPLGLEWL
jgi:hypothetical protein